MEVDYSSSNLICDRQSRNQNFHAGRILSFVVTIFAFLFLISLRLSFLTIFFFLFQDNKVSLKKAFRHNHENTIFHPLQCPFKEPKGNSEGRVKVKFVILAVMLAFKAVEKKTKNPQA